MVKSILTIDLRSGLSEYMGILDQLMEKKDLLIYIEVRIAALKKEQNTAIKLPEKKRELTRRIIAGRMRELKTLKSMVHHDKLKEYSKDNWSDLMTIES